MDDLVEVVRGALGGLPVAAATDPDQLRVAVPVAEVLGPADLAYLDGRDFRPDEAGPVETFPGDHADLAALLASVTADDAAECGLAEITSPAFVVRSGTKVVAAAGYRHWSGQVAHICVLTAPDWRGRGLARVVATAAVADGLANRLLPQWRTRVEPSRRVARALGFRQLGAQLSIRVAHYC
jgi:GNAT superfamily N-acetyltransferase